MASAVGDDQMGVNALNYADSYGIKKDYIAVLPGKSTGYCKVTLENGHPCYELVRDVAYDEIPKLPINRSFDAIYYGTLAQRDQRSAGTLDYILSNVSHKQAFFDINIRQKFYTPETIEKSLKQCYHFKIEQRRELRFWGVCKFRGTVPQTI